MKQLLTKKEVAENVSNLFEQIYVLDAQILMVMNEVKIPIPNYYKELLTLIILFDREKSNILHYIFGDTVTITPIINAHPDMQLIIFAEKELNRIKSVMREFYMQIKFLSYHLDKDSIPKSELESYEKNIENCLGSLKRILLSHDEFLDRISELSNVDKETLIKNPDIYLNGKTIHTLCELSLKSKNIQPTFFENLD